MASLFKRSVRKLLEKDETPSTATISRPEGGNVTFVRKEIQRYTMLHALLDSDEDGEIGGAEGAAFLRRSGLDDAGLREIWRMASGGTSKAKLTRDDFLVACKLVAVAQARPGGVPTMAPLLANEAVGLADFHYDLAPDASLGGAGVAETELPRASIAVSVGNSAAFGSGIDKHTRFSVKTITSLPMYPRKELAVWRCVH